MPEINLADFYDPLPKQRQFHYARWAHRFRLMTGGAGSGKSLALLWEAITLGLLYPGSQHLLLRKNYPELEKGLIRDLHSSVPAAIYKWNDQKHTATLTNGSIIFFGHCESERDLAEYLSAAFVFIGFDEMGQFSFEAWDFLMSRNRVNLGCKPDSKGIMPLPGMAGATNPFGLGWAWIKSLFVDKKPVPQLGKGANYDPNEYTFVHSTVLDNKHQLERDPGYVQRLQSMSVAKRKMFLEGDLNSLEGSYFSNFQYEQHVIDVLADAERIQWQPWQPCWGGLDWGIAHFAVFLWFTRALIRRLDGSRKLAIVCYREMCVNETDINDVAKLVKECTSGAHYGSAEAEIKKVRRVFVSHELFARRASPRPDQTIAAELSRALVGLGLPACERASGSASHQERIDGAALIRNHLTTGDIYFTSNCEQLIRAIPLLARDDKDKEDVAKTSGIEDDLFDALKHGTLSLLHGEQRPKEDIVREQAQSIPGVLERWQYLTKNLAGTKQQQRVHQSIRMPWETGR